VRGFDRPFLRQTKLETNERNVEMKCIAWPADNEQKFHVANARAVDNIFNLSIILYLLKLYIYTPSNQHFKAFLVSKFNSETSFLYQLFKENSNFIVTEPGKVVCNSIFYDFH
jgi:hypothetical protein